MSMSHYSNISDYSPGDPQMYAFKPDTQLIAAGMPTICRTGQSPEMPNRKLADLHVYKHIHARDDIQTHAPTCIQATWVQGHVISRT